ARDQSSADLAPVDIAPMEPIGVVPRLLVVGAFHSNQCAEVFGMRVGELEHDSAANRAAHQHGSVQTQRATEGQNRLDVELGGEPILGLLRSRWRIGLSMPG